MSLYNIFDIAGSGMSAQTTRLNLVASNMANADTVSSSTGETYRARQPVFAAVLQNEISNNQQPAAKGVRVAGVIESQAPLREEYAPQHPMANEEVNTAKQLLQQTLKIGQ